MKNVENRKLSTPQSEVLDSLYIHIIRCLHSIQWRSSTNVETIKKRKDAEGWYSYGVYQTSDRDGKNVDGGMNK